MSSLEDPEPITRSGRRLGWALSDQALSSGTNFLLGLQVARSVSTEAFGAFGIAFATYLVVLGSSRALTTEPLAVTHSTAPADEWRHGAAAATGTALTTGLIAAFGSLIAAAATDGTLRASLLVLALSLPGLILQDAWRFSFFTGARGREGFTNDLVWAIVLVPAIIILPLAGLNSVAWLMVAWGGSATLAAIYGGVQAGFLPRPRMTRTWLQGQREFAPRFLGEFFASSGASQVATFGIGAIAGLDAVAALRGAGLLLGPLHILFMGFGLIAVPEGARLRRDERDLTRALHVMALVLALVALVWGAALTLLPESVGTSLLGSTWMAAKDVIVPLGIAYATIGATLGATTGVRVLGAARASLRARLITSPLKVIGQLAGSAVAGAPGAAWAEAGTGAMSAAIWWQTYRSAERTDATGRSDAAARPA